MLAIGTKWLFGQLAEAGHGFVDGVVDLKVLALQVDAALPPVVEPRAADLNVVFRPGADQQGIAHHAAGLIEQGGGRGPQALVEHGRVEGCQDTVECILVAHDITAFLAYGDIAPSLVQLQASSDQSLILSFQDGICS